jgi:NADPH-dependent 2,4-dienoyl-CoA reductase/sulfur reductase-like enzyme
VEKVVLSDGTTVAADLVVVGVGAVPNVEWLSDSGLDVTDGVTCDATLCAGSAGVYAAGDVARWMNPLFGRYQRLEHFTTAADQGAAAALNAIGQTPTDFSTVPYFWSDLYGSRIQFVGIPEADEVEVLESEDADGGRWVALYRVGHAVVGALTINAPRDIMRYRKLIAAGADFDEAIKFGLERRGTNRPA